MATNKEGNKILGCRKDTLPIPITCPFQEKTGWKDK
jgi:hypothetical protein